MKIQKIVMVNERKKHWNNIYETKQLSDLGWYQPTPTTSLEFVQKLNIPYDAKIIDIGGGDSFFVDHLLDLGYTEITVLDISEKAISRAKERLAANASKVKWIVADASDFKPVEQYYFWHDRAAFHFLTLEKEINSYLETIQRNISPSGFLVIGTFSDDGPKQCSGIDIKQYSESLMAEMLTTNFRKIECLKTEHTTPSGSIQNFIFCSFKKL